MTQFHGNPHRFRGKFGQMRLPAIHKWSWDRQGAHCAFGALIPGPIFFIGVLTDSLPLVLGSLAITYIFIQYERSENVSVGDHAYPDIFGCLCGVTPWKLASAGLEVLHWLSVL